MSRIRLIAIAIGALIIAYWGFLLCFPSQARAISFVPLWSIPYNTIGILSFLVGVLALIGCLMSNPILWKDLAIYALTLFGVTLLCFVRAFILKSEGASTGSLLAMAAISSFPVWAAITAIRAGLTARPTHPEMNATV